MAVPGLIYAFTAEGAILPNRIVAVGSADGQVVQAAATDPLLGATGCLGSADGEVVDIALSGIVGITFGGAVTRGDLLTADADGKAVTASPAAGVNVRTVGIALVSGAADEVCDVLIHPSQIQG